MRLLGAEHAGRHRGPQVLAHRLPCTFVDVR
jgi:hypothetical protein